MTWTPRLTLFVPGIPRPGGSKKACPRYGRDGKPIMAGGRVLTNTVEMGKHTPAWRADVKAAAAAAWGDLPLLDAPLAITVTFTMPRPKSHFWTGKRAGQLRPDAPHFHTSAPDATKLLRALEDAITKVVWFDDGRIGRQVVEKVYGDKPGAQIVIEEMVADEPAREPVVAAPLFAEAGGAR